MYRVTAIASMAFRRVLRTRILLVALILAACVLLAFSATMIKGLAQVRAEEGAEAAARAMPALLNWMLTALGLIVAGIAAVIGATVVRNDLTAGTVFGVLSKPLSRVEYLLGNVLGGWMHLVVLWVVFGIAVTALAVIVETPIRPIYYLIMLARLLQATICLSVALLFSTRVNTWIAVSLTVLVVNGAECANGLVAILRAAHVEVPEGMTDVLRWPFPVLGAIDAITERLTRGTLRPLPVLPGLIHLFDYAVAMFVLACLSFRSLELNHASD